MDALPTDLPATESGAARTLTFSAAIREAFHACMEHDPAVFLMGEGVADPKGIFGTTTGLVEKFGSDRVMETPVSENAVTGIALGASIMGLKPVIMHQRVDFSLVSLDQIINNASKWYYMNGGMGGAASLVIRMVIGQGWGQGPQHAQSLESVFAHVPGLKVVMPSSPRDAKGLMIAAIQDPNPVIYIDHRWLHGTEGHVPEGRYAHPLQGGRVARSGDDVTLMATSYRVVEALKAADVLGAHGISAEVVDMTVLRPLDVSVVAASVAKTGRLVTVDTGWTSFGIGGEVIARINEEHFGLLKAAPVRLGMPDYPSPSSRSLLEHYYPRAATILRAVGTVLNLAPAKLGRLLEAEAQLSGAVPLDVPDPHFKGPF